MIRQRLQPGPGERHQFKCRVNPEFCHEALQVGAHRIGRELKLGRDLFTAGPFKQVGQDISLAWREIRQKLVAAAAIVLIVDQEAQHLA
jgi:hypothetical protein